MSRAISRHLEAVVGTALNDTRVVTVNGARQVGKSTLVTRVTRGRSDAEIRTLDDGATLAAARSDPTRFVRHDGLLAIDEIQREPNLLLAIKSAVDRENRPGQFLLTGSARVMALKAAPDSLVGRMETVELWPFSQGELSNRREDFIASAFDDDPTFSGKAESSRDELIERLVIGGFPEAVRRDEARRAKFFESYAHDLVDRDIAQLADIQNRDALHELLRASARLGAQLLKNERLASETGVPASTVERYLSLFEMVFLLKRLPAWSNRATERAVRMKKILFTDTGLCAFLQQKKLKRLLSDDVAVGALLENFVLGELARQCGWSSVSASLSHFRTRDGVEVDGILEADDGRLVGIEVKASETVRLEDFSGLHHFAARTPKQFHHGIVLYAGERALPFGARLTAVPVDFLWR